MGRTSEFQACKAYLLNSQSIVIQGGAGKGKDALANVLIHEKEILEYFDEIVWLVVSREDVHKNDSKSLLLTLIDRLGGNQEIVNHALQFTPWELPGRLAEMIGQRRILVILEDVRDANILKQFQAAGLVLLVTTRQRSTAVRLKGTYSDAKVIHLDTLGAKDALLLLETHLGTGSEQLTSSQMTKLISLTRYIPDNIIRLADHIKYSAETGGDIQKVISRPVDNQLLFPNDGNLTPDEKMVLEACSVFLPDVPFDDDVLMSTAGVEFNSHVIDHLEEWNYVKKVQSPSVLEYLITVDTTVAMFMANQLDEVNTELYRQRLIKSYVDYVIEHKEDFDLLEAQYDQIMKVLELAHEKSI